MQVSRAWLLDGLQFPALLAFKAIRRPWRVHTGVSPASSNVSGVPASDLDVLLKETETEEQGPSPITMPALPPEHCGLC